uniref:Uncharacterized protein n=1 Tax=Rhizophora mucronata TaxID=61149 RepID=A0A2P2P7E5_RHIMU
MAEAAIATSSDKHMLRCSPRTLGGLYHYNIHYICLKLFFKYQKFSDLANFNIITEVGQVRYPFDPCLPSK